MNSPKKTLVFTLLIALTASSVFITSCSDRFDDLLQELKLNLPATPYNYTEVQTAHGATIDLSVRVKDESKDVFSDHTATLGRVLFYDTRMSINNTVSCASCHDQSKAFADNVDLSIGFANKKTLRNSMAILNPIDNNNMFWDSRSKSPMTLSLEPVFNHIEMGMESEEMLIQKITGTSYYPELFEKAYGSTEVDREKIAKAIATFLNSMFSQNSKFDEGLATDFNNFTALESMGKHLFESDRLQCASCHSGINFVAPDGPGGPYGSSFGRGGINNIDPTTGFPIFTDDFPDNGPRGTANIGLDLVYKDNGRSEGQFKIPSLRNVALTAPYMHDGRFNTLEEVLDHYSHGIQMHPNLDSKFVKNGKPIRLNLTETEKMALVAFLNTLTDEQLISDPKFSNPFH